MPSEPVLEPDELLLSSAKLRLTTIYVATLSILVSLASLKLVPLMLSVTLTSAISSSFLTVIVYTLFSVF